MRVDLHIESQLAFENDNPMTQPAEESGKGHSGRAITDDSYHEVLLKTSTIA